MPAETAFVAAARSEDVTGARFLRVAMDGGDLLLVRLADGSAAAFPLGCPHQGHSMTRGMLIEGDQVECPHHFYAYDARTGRNTWPGDQDDPTLTVYATDERDGWVFVALPAGRGR